MNKEVRHGNYKILTKFGEEIYTLNSFDIELYGEITFMDIFIKKSY